jgi:hypothetical protein
MPRMLALRDLTYDYAQVEEGVEFNAGEQEARTLEIIGYATRQLKMPEALPDPSLNAGQIDESMIRKAIGCITETSQSESMPKGDVCRLSAYEDAVRKGFKGSEAEFLARCPIGPSDTGLSAETREPEKPKRGRPKGAKNKYSRRDLTAE